MTNDERIEVCLNVLTNYVDYEEYYLRKAVIDILAAADVEGMVRKAAKEGFSAGHVVHWGKGGSWQKELDAIVARVMQGAG